MDTPSALPEMLTRLRRRAGLTQEALADLTGVSIRTIGALERGERGTPHRDTIRRLAAALRTEPAALYQAAPTTVESPGSPAVRAGAAGRSPLPAYTSEALAAAMQAGGRFDAALSELETARRLFRARADADGCARTHAAIGEIHILRGRCDLALAEAEGAPSGTQVSSATGVRLATVVARARELRGEFPQALESAQAALTAARIAGDSRLLTPAEIRYASICTQLGRLEQARLSFERATELAMSSDDELRLIQADTGLAIVLLRRGPVAQARVHAERALAGAERCGDIARVRAAAVHAASAAREAGDEASASRLARIAAFPDCGEESVHTHHGRVLLSLLALDAGRAARARALLEPIADPVRSTADDHTRREAAALLIAADLLDGRTGVATHRRTGSSLAADLVGLVVPDICWIAVQMLLRSGLPADAVRLATDFGAAATGSGSVLHLVEALRSRAAARREQADLSGASEDHREAVALAERGGFVLRRRLLANPTWERGPHTFSSKVPAGGV